MSADGIKTALSLQVEKVKKATEEISMPVIHV